MALEIGTPAPDFCLHDQHGSEFRLSDHFGRVPVVLFFYPKDFTPGCTAEVCSFRDSYAEFTDTGALVVGISSDSEKSHSKFASRFGLPFPLLSDPKGEVRKAYGVKPQLFGLLPGRETFVIDREGRIALSYDSVRATSHRSKALAVLQKQN